MRIRSASVSVGFSPVVPHGHEKMNAGIDLTPRQAPHRGFVELAALRERRHERGPHSSKRCSHDVLQALKPRLPLDCTPDLPYPTYLPYPTPSTSFIVNQPRLPCTHRAAASAPRANAVRSRAVWVSVIVSAGPSNPMVCVPGMKPARVELTSIGRAKPALLHRLLQRQRRARRRVLLRRVMRLVNERAELRLRREQLRRLRRRALRTGRRRSRNSARRRCRCRRRRPPGAARPRAPTSRWCR